MEPTIILTSPIWLYLLFFLFFRPKSLTINLVAATILSLPHIFLIGALGAMLFDSPSAGSEATVIYLSFVFGIPAVAVSISVILGQLLKEKQR